MWYKTEKNCFWNSTSWYRFNRNSANGSNKFEVIPMGVFSFGAVAVGIVNLSIVEMGIISAGITTMGVWEYGSIHLILKNIIIPNKSQLQTRGIRC